MAPHPSVLAWRLPGAGEPGGLPSTGSHRVDTTAATLQQRGTWEPLYTRPLCVSWCHSGGEPTSQCTRHRGAGSIPGSGRAPGGGNGNHSSIPAWRIPWTAEPGGPQSMGSRRAGHDSTEQPSVSQELCLSAYSIILKKRKKTCRLILSSLFFHIRKLSFPFK